MSDELEDALRRHVAVLAGEIGERNTTRPDAYARAADYIRTVWERAGYEVRESQGVIDGVPSRTLESTVAGASPETVLVGAHYDSILGCPGANDNGSGVAALLEISRVLAASNPARTLRFVAFPDEEPPYFESPEMGSKRYAAIARARGDRFSAVIVFDTIGYYSDVAGSQQYPSVFGWFYPDRGNFITIVGNLGSRRLVRRVTKYFREAGDFPVESAAVPSAIRGVSWSDHASFWEQGYRAVMVTDTAPYRYPHYHLPSDTPDKVDYPSLARVTQGMAHVVTRLASAP